jgi:putative selenium metabolism protein SsnA
VALVIKNGYVVTKPLAGGFRVADVLVEGDRVAAVGEGQAAWGADVIDAAGCWVLPGLIDAHTHLYGALSAGMPAKDVPPQNFPQVLHRVWWRLDKALSPEDVRYSGYVGAIASLRQGITTIFDHHASPSCPDSSLDILAAVVRQVGLRASLAYEVSDRDGPAARDAGIGENRAFFLACQQTQDPMLKAHFGLHAVFSLSDETLLRCAEIGRELGAGFHLHVVEHRTELEKFQAEHDGLGVVAYLDQIGILGPRTIAAHTVHVTEEDAERLARTGATTVHNPKSNMGNGVGVAPVGMLIRHGVRAGLGSDGYYDMPQQIITAPLLQCLHAGNPSAFSGDDALRMVYGNNSALAEQTFGLPFGQIAPGYAADLLIVPYEPATPVDTGNLGAHIVAALVAGPRHVVIGGAVRMRNGELQGLDVPAIHATARQLAARLWQRL